MTSNDLPNDADGDAIRGILKHGSDFSRPMLIDFAAAVPNQAAGVKIAEVATERGFVTDVSFDEEDEHWTCYCSKNMFLSHAAVVAIQREIAEIGKPFDGFPDGWGTFGNVEKKA